MSTPACHPQVLEFHESSLRIIEITWIIQALRLLHRQGTAHETVTAFPIDLVKGMPKVIENKRGFV